jgi:hypothetical protein
MFNPKHHDKTVTKAVFLFIHLLFIYFFTSKINYWFMSTISAPSTSVYSHMKFNVLTRPKKIHD